MAERELVLIVAEGCPYCEEAKKALPKDNKIILDVTKKGVDEFCTKWEEVMELSPEREDEYER